MPVALPRIKPPRMTVRDLEALEPWTGGHRGSMYHAAENTLEAFRQVKAAGIPVLEADVVLLRDGSLGVMHDSTVDRTTTSTGNVFDHDANSWQQLVVDSSAQLDGAPGYPNTSPPLLTDFLDEFGSSGVLALEAKQNAGRIYQTIDRLVEVIRQYRLEKSVIFNAQATDEDWFEAPLEAGIACAMQGATLDNYALEAMGVEWMWFAATTAQATVEQAQDLYGFKTALWSVDRRVTRDQWAAVGGVRGYFSNDPIYVAELNVEQVTDPFDRGVWLPGGALQASGFRGSLSSGKWHYAIDSYVCHGWAERKGSPDDFSITLKIDFSSIPGDATRFATVAVCADKDPSAISSITGCYEVLQRLNGWLYIFRRDAGATTQVAAVDTGSVIAEGGTAELEIVVSPTDVSARRLNGANTGWATYAHSTYRGPYMYLGKNGAGMTCSFYDFAFA